MYKTNVSIAFFLCASSNIILQTTKQGRSPCQLQDNYPMDSRLRPPLRQSEGSGEVNQFKKSPNESEGFFERSIEFSNLDFQFYFNMPRRRPLVPLKITSRTHVKLEDDFSYPCNYLSYPCKIQPPKEDDLSPPCKNSHSPSATSFWGMPRSNCRANIVSTLRR